MAQYPYGFDYPIVLNSFLLFKQKIGPSSQKKLHDTHVERQRIFKAMHETDPTNVSQLLDLAKEFDGLEYYQQALWKFSLDPLFHHWFAVPHCSCRRQLGELYYGRESIRVINVNCSVHGQLLGGTRMIVGNQQLVTKDDRGWTNLIKFEKFPS